VCLWGVSRGDRRAGGIRTVTNDGGVDNEGQERHLVLSRVVLQQSSRVVVTDGRVSRTLGNSSAHGGRNDSSLEQHGGGGGGGDVMEVSLWN